MKRLGTLISTITASLLFLAFLIAGAVLAPTGVGVALLIIAFIIFFPSAIINFTVWYQFKRSNKASRSLIIIAAIFGLLSGVAGGVITFVGLN